MTRYYTHVGEFAAVQAVAALPALMGDAKPAPPKPQEPGFLREIRATAESMAANNWAESKAALLAILAPPSANDSIGHEFRLACRQRLPPIRYPHRLYRRPESPNVSVSTGADCLLLKFARLAVPWRQGSRSPHKLGKDQHCKNHG